MAAELVNRAELDRLAGAFAAAGLRVLFLKGAALAYLAYPEPWTRPRTDTDLWCGPDEGPAVERVLASLGYQATGALAGGGRRQFQMERRARDGTHRVDVHLRLFNVSPLDEALGYAEALAASRPVGAIAGARALSPAHALFHACLHRVAHHDDADLLVWTCDVHRLASGFRDDDWAAVVELAVRSRTGAACGAGLRRAAAAFGTPVPAAVLGALDAAPPGPADALVGGGLREIDLQWFNLRHRRGWRARLTLLRGHLLPPVAYMRARYGYPRGWVRLPGLYLHRIAAGARRWWQPARGPAR